MGDYLGFRTELNVSLSYPLQVLSAKALEVRDALLEALVSKAREQNVDIISRYDSILARIAEKPANEADLAALRGFISESKEKVRFL